VRGGIRRKIIFDDPDHDDFLDRLGGIGDAMIWPAYSAQIAGQHHMPVTQPDAKNTVLA
jgi:hypothetical protein